MLLGEWNKSIVREELDLVASGLPVVMKQAGQLRNVSIRAECI